LRQVRNVRGDLRCGRPARYAKRRVSPLFTYLPYLSLPRTNIKKALGRALSSKYAGIGLTLYLQISTMHEDPVPPPDNMPFPYDANAYPGRRSSAAPFCNEMVDVQHPSNATPSAETTNRPAPPLMAATSIARARIRTFITSQRSTDNLPCRREVFWSVLESCLRMGWNNQYLLGCPSAPRLVSALPLDLHLRGSPLGSHSQRDCHGISS